jgi:hypothetical protein
MELLGKNYTRSQLINDFRFAARTVDRAIEAYKKLRPDTAERGQNNQGEDEDADADHSLPVTLKRAEVITPEGILQRVLSDGSPDWQLRVEGMMLLRAAQKMNLDDMELAKGQAEVHAKMLKPLLDTMIEISREQDAAARRAMGSNEEVAYRAANDVARQLAPEIQGLRSHITVGTAPDPFTRMVNIMQTMPRLIQTGQQLMQMMGMPVPGIAPQPGQAQQQPGQQLQPQQIGESGQQSPPQSQGQMQPGQPAPSPLGTNFQTMTDEEREAIFGGGR